MKMKSIAGIISAAAIGTAIITGCSPDESYVVSSRTVGPEMVTPAPNVLPADQDTPAPTTEPEDNSDVGSVPTNPDEKYLWYLRNSETATDGEVSIPLRPSVEDDVIRFGRAVCTDLGNDVYSTPAVAAYMLGQNSDGVFTQNQVNYLVVAAVIVYCPWEDE